MLFVKLIFLFSLFAFTGFSRYTATMGKTPTRKRPGADGRKPAMDGQSKARRSAKEAEEGHVLDPNDKALIGMQTQRSSLGVYEGSAQVPVGTGTSHQSRLLHLWGSFLSWSSEVTYDVPLDASHSSNMRDKVPLLRQLDYQDGGRRCSGLRAVNPALSSSM